VRRKASEVAMLDRMQTVRLKVYRHLNDWFEEFRLYHRKDGKVVKASDDLMAATRYGVMMLRHASCQKRYGFSRKLEMPQLGIV
jgi:terminase large subunit-like protein